MLESPEEVRRQREEVNAIFREVGSKSQESLQRTSWEKGVEERAYYITGAHMAQVIDAHLGREALIGTLIRGPLSFVETYNTLVSIDRRVLFPSDEVIAARENEAEQGTVARDLLLGLGAILFAVSLLWYILRRRRRSAA
jgi:hypothetical protein